MLIGKGEIIFLMDVAHKDGKELQLKMFKAFLELLLWTVVSGDSFYKLLQVNNSNVLTKLKKLLIKFGNLNLYLLENWFLILKLRHKTNTIPFTVYTHV